MSCLAKNNSDRLKKLEGEHETFQEYVSALTLKLEGAWKTGTPETAIVNIPLGHMLDLLFTWTDLKRQLEELRKAQRANATATAGNADMRFISLAVGETAQIEENRPVVLMARVKDHPVIEENARLFESRANLGT